MSIYDEPQAPPLKSSMASIVIEHVVETGMMAAKSKRQVRSNGAAMQLLKQFEQQGGKL